MESVWLLQHVHKFDDWREDVKLIGIFRSRSEAEFAQAKVASQPGFCDLPNGFSLEEHKLGSLGWTEGYVTININTDDND
jgi:hypothetical protein